MNHPSNKLYRGECTDFLDALRTYRASLDYELSTNGPDDVEFSKMLTDSIAATERAEKEYLEEIEKTNIELSKKWYASEDNNFEMLANVLTTGHYEQLAI